jgi:mannose-6-phosphate isomerase class I
VQTLLCVKLLQYKQVSEEECYAELWMGTHPNGPSRVVPDSSDSSSPSVGRGRNGRGMFLIELLETHPQVLGDLEEVRTELFKLSL